MASIPYERSLRALDGQRAGPWFAAMPALLIAGWAAWALWAPVRAPLRAVSAHLESISPEQPVQAAVAGRVVALHARPDAWVERGQVLVALDASEIEASLLALEARRSATRAQLVAIDQALATAQTSRELAPQIHANSFTEARAATLRSRTLLVQAERESARLSLSTPLGITSIQDLERARTVVAQRRGELERERAAQSRFEAELARDTAEREVSLAGLERERTERARTLVALDTELAVLELERERHLIRAPVDGHLTHLERLQLGDLILAGRRLGAILPTGALRIMATFPADLGLAHLQPGARGHMQLHAYPWTWFGQMEVVVERVAAEPRDGLLLAELSLLTAHHLPIRHGLTGEIEVELARSTPLERLFGIHGAPTRLANPAPPESPHGPGPTVAP